MSATALSRWQKRWDAELVEIEPKRRLFWARYFWHEAMKRRNEASEYARQCRAEVKRLEAQR